MVVLNFNLFKIIRLFDMVCNNDAQIWGTKDISCINSVKHRAICFFMGAGRYTPNMALYGDMGWKPCK